MLQTARCRRTQPCTVQPLRKDDCQPGRYPADHNVVEQQGCIAHGRVGAFPTAGPVQKRFAVLAGTIRPCRLDDCISTWSSSLKLSQLPLQPDMLLKARGRRQGRARLSEVLETITFGNYVKGEATLPCIGGFLSCSLQSLRSLLTKKQWTLVGVIVALFRITTTSPCNDVLAVGPRPGRRTAQGISRGIEVVEFAVCVLASRVWYACSRLVDLQA